jgi:hypothetical protein
VQIFNEPCDPALLIESTYDKEGLTIPLKISALLSAVQSDTREGKKNQTKQQKKPQRNLIFQKLIVQKLANARRYRHDYQAVDDWSDMCGSHRMCVLVKSSHGASLDQFRDHRVINAKVGLEARRTPGGRAADDS